jgi:pyrimidine operon attenuation protein/uracil phosphoribosyltransferase
MQGTLILNHREIEQKIERITWQIYEEFSHEKAVILIGIQGNGSILADLICDKLKSISSMDITRGDIQLDKTASLPGHAELICPKSLENQSVVLIDDVLNSGKTILMALVPLVNQAPGNIKTVVLADRNHKQFPVSADIVGITLSTTLHEHIYFDIHEGSMKVSLG